MRPRTMKIGSQIRSIRREKSLLQSDLAEKASITQSYLSQIENNHKEPSVSTLKRLAEVLGIPLPGLLLLSLDEGDVDEDRRELFNAMLPQLRKFFTDTKEGS